MEQKFITIKYHSFRATSIEAFNVQESYGDCGLMVQLSTRIDPYYIRCETVQEMNELFEKANAILDAIKVGKE